MPTTETHELPLGFEARHGSGTVVVRVWSNEDPAAVGADEAASGFPVCEATVSTSLRGYDALFGWIQLVGEVRPPSHDRVFAIDPLRIFEAIDLPFAFYGVEPTLFDAPSRRDRQPALDWLAHSFLCCSPEDAMARAVVPVAAFQWGFRMGGGEVTLVPPTSLPLAAWDDHRPLLAARHPGWSFEAAE